MHPADVQRIAKETVRSLRRVLRAGLLLSDVRRLCEEELRSRGADSFWYYGIGAFVFAGEETTVSVSGRDYATSSRVIARDDIVTVDLSPQVGDVWGDYARTLIVEGGAVVPSVDEIKNEAWRRGLLTEAELHRELMRLATPEMTFEELYYCMNDAIRSKGYVNLDFLGNLGHSIAKKREERIYIETRKPRQTARRAILHL